MQKNAHIIGAGISGLSAAVRLANAGYRVHVHEATQQAGGRCRSYFDAATNLTIDNGNHLLLSGNRHALAYARSIGTEAGLVGPKRRAVSLRRHHDRPALAARPRRRQIAAMGVRRGAPRPGYQAARLSRIGAAGLGRHRQAGRRHHPVQGHAVRSAGAAAAAGGAQCRSARGFGGPRRRDRAGNAAGGRAGLPAADRARRPERGAGRAGDQAVAGQGCLDPVRP